MSDTSLVFNVLAKDNASAVFRKIHANAKSASSGLIAAFGPGLMPVLAAATGAVAGLGGALVSVGAAAAVFGGVFADAFGEVKEASDKTQGLRDKIQLLNEQIKVANETGIGDAGKLEQAREKATNELIARYRLMPPALRQVTMAYDGMKASWQGFVDVNKPVTFGIMTSGFSLISTILPKLQPLFDAGAVAADKLLTRLKGFATGGGLDKMVAFLSGQAGPAFNNLIAIARNVGVALGNTFAGFAPAGQGILAWLNQVTAKWAAWSQQTSGGGLQAFVAYVQANGPKVVSLLSQLAQTGMHIAQAVAPLAPISLAVAGALASIINALPPGVITALVAGWVAYTVALKAYHAYTLIVGTATKVWAGIQWLLNTAMLANPIILIVMAVIALIAVIVLVATKTRFFQTIWEHVWGFLKMIGAWFAGPFKNFFVAGWNAIKNAAVAAWNWIKNAAVTVFNWFMKAAKMYISIYVGAWNLIKNGGAAAWNWIKSKALSFYNWVIGIPGKISSRLATMWNGLKNGFRAAINWVIARWNNFSIGLPGISFAGISVPGVRIDTPNIPYLDTGGSVLRSGLAVIHRGEEVQPAKVTRRRSEGGHGVLVVDLRGADTEMGRMFAKMLRTQPAVANAVKVHLKLS